MKTKIEIKTFWGKLLFEFEKEDNTIKDTVIEALRRGANLRGANLQEANLQEANLRGANLQGAKGKELSDLKKFFWIIPEEGSFIAWKKCEDAIVKLQVPAKAKRTSNLLNRKCRAEFVKVLAIWDMEGNKIEEAKGTWNATIYKVGKITKADSFDDDYLNDCSHGIHFFITRQEAEEYN